MLPSLSTFLGDHHHYDYDDGDYNGYEYYDDGDYNGYEDYDDGDYDFDSPVHINIPMIPMTVKYHDYDYEEYDHDGRFWDTEVAERCWDFSKCGCPFQPWWPSSSSS